MTTQLEFNSAWKEQKVVSEDGTPEDWFGSAVAISGEWAFIGAKNKAVGSNPSQGVVYVFKKVRGTWVQAQKLVAEDGQAIDQFGTAIAAANGIVMISAPFAKIGENKWQGAVYIFTISRSSPSSTSPWVQKNKLTAANGRAFQTFGVSIALNLENTFIGSGGTRSGDQYVPRTVHVFRRDRTTSVAIEKWSEKQLIENPTPQDAGNSFGRSLAISDNFVLIGAGTSTIDGNPGQGAAYIYFKSGGSWKLQKKLTAPDGSARDNFGVSVALYKNLALVGAQGVFTTGPSGGAVYQFEAVPSGWKQTRKFSAIPDVSLSLFGADMDVSKDGTLLVGAYATTNYRGAAYFFNLRNDTWIQKAELTASDGAAGSVFGYYIALDENTVLIGAYTTQVGSNARQGAAYFYTIPQNLP